MIRSARTARTAWIAKSAIVGVITYQSKPSQAPKIRTGRKVIQMETLKGNDRRVSFGGVSVLSGDSDDSNSLNSQDTWIIVSNNNATSPMEYEQESKEENGNDDNVIDMEVDREEESVRYAEEEQDPAQIYSPFDVEVSHEAGYFQGNKEAEEARQGCYATGVPKLEEWEEYTCNKIEFTFGAARDRLWYHATKENIDNLVMRGIDDIALQNDLLKVYKFLFGTNGSLYCVFEQYLDLSKEDYLIFLQTFFLSCKNKQNVSALSTTFDIQHKLYLNPKVYNKI